MSDEEILEAISAYPSDMVILTGGEPALWIDEAFIDMLHKAGKYICIETNGTRPLPKGIDWVTCSPKEGAPLKIDHMRDHWIVTFYAISISLCVCKLSCHSGCWRI